MEDFLTFSETLINTVYVIILLTRNSPLWNYKRFILCMLNVIFAEIRIMRDELWVLNGSAWFHCLNHLSQWQTWTQETDSSKDIPMYLLTYKKSHFKLTWNIFDVHLVACNTTHAVPKMYMLTLKYGSTSVCEVSISIS